MAENRCTIAFATNELKDLTEAVMMVALANVLKTADDLHVMRSANPDNEGAQYRLTRWLNGLDIIIERLDASLEIWDDGTAVDKGYSVLGMYDKREDGDQE